MKHLVCLLTAVTLFACSTPDYTNDTAPDLCDHMNIETDSPGYPTCFTVAAQIYQTYPGLDMQALIDQADQVCDDADLDSGDQGYPTCFMRVSTPLVKEKGIDPYKWESALQKIILIEKNYNSTQ